MKKVIIAAVDFSDGSLSALRYAVRIANAISANILMVWVDKLKSSKSIYADAFDPRLEAKKRFEEIMDEYRPQLTGGKFMFKIRDGKVHKEIVNQAKYHDAHLIVAGTHGSSGFEEFWIGSNAYKIVTYAPCPVITIRRDESIETEVNNIVVPIDSSRQTRQKVPFITQFAKALGAKINILSLYSTKVETVRDLVDRYTEQTKEYIEERNVPYQVFSRECKNLTVTTIDFAKEIQADMIGVMTEQESNASNLLLGPYAQQMVNHSPIPVLSYHNKSIYDYQTKG
jgi:nucleotide-binding universal stress UspA family protein